MTSTNIVIIPLPEVDVSLNASQLKSDEIAKINTIVTNGNGYNFLADDGQYKPLINDITAYVGSSINNAINNTVNPSIASSINNAITDTINPSITTSINDAISNTINPSITISINNAITDTINPSITTSISDAISNTVNPSIASSINSAITNTINPSITTSINDAISNTINPSITNAINNLGTLFKLMGRIDTVADLPIDANAGEVYIVGLSESMLKSEYVRLADGTWEKYGDGSIDLALLKYYTKDEVDKLNKKANAYIKSFEGETIELDTQGDDTLINLEFYGKSYHSDVPSIENPSTISSVGNTINIKSDDGNNLECIKEVLIKDINNNVRTLNGFTNRLDSIISFDGEYYITKQTETRIINGQENFFNTPMPAHPTYALFEYGNYSITEEFLCNKFVKENTYTGSVSQYVPTKECCFYSNTMSSIHFVILKSRLTSNNSTGFKQWLASNNLEMILSYRYAANYKSYKLDSQEALKLNEVMTYPKKTYLSTLNSVKPFIKGNYTADWLKILNTMQLINSVNIVNELKPNIYYRYGEVYSLTLTLEIATNENIVNEYLFEFISGETATTLSLPIAVKWVGGIPIIEPLKIYQCSIINNIGILVSVEITEE